MPIPIVYEDEYLLIIDKPTGVSVTEEPFHKNKHDVDTDLPLTIRSWVKDRYNLISFDNGLGDSFEQRFGIVHRLDKETSGILLIAKNLQVFNYLKGLFKYRRIIKEYQALVYNTIADTMFEISAPLGRNRTLGTAYGIDPDGRESVTKFKVLQRYNKFLPSTYLLAYPKTGRTHQIRVHLKAFGHPIVNDHKYASKSFLESSKNLPSRMMLHSKSIAFTDWDGKNRKFESSYNLLDCLASYFNV